MGNKQPFYHQVDELLFTSTTGFGKEQFIATFNKFARSKAGKELGIIPDTIEMHTYYDPEPGSPDDLME